MMQWKETEFCWTDIGVMDVNKAKEFYTKVFGWDYNEVPMGESSYIMWRVEGIESGGMYQLNDEQKKQGVPPHWMNYFHTNGADDFAKRAKAGGANALMEPFDVGDMGRMCIMADPTGAHMACWQPRENQKNLASKFAAGKVAWRELLTSDVERAGKFYCDVIPGWTIESEDMGPFKYHMFKAGETYEAGMMAIQKDWGPMPSNWMTYVNVEDCDKAVDMIKAEGGQAFHEPREVPEVGRFCMVADNQGAAFAVIKMPRK